MPNINNNFFVLGLDKRASISKQNGSNHLAKLPTDKLESSQFLRTLDLICEGPIEGLVDKEGNTLKYLANNDADDLVLGKGIYYNDVPLIASHQNKFNFAVADFNIDYGNEFSSLSDLPSTVFNYNQKIFLNENSDSTLISKEIFQKEERFVKIGGTNYWKGYVPNVEETYYKVSLQNRSDIRFNRTYHCIKRENNEWSYLNSGDFYITSNFDKVVEGFSRLDLNNERKEIETPVTSYAKIADFYEKAKLNSIPFNHKIKNKYCDFLTVNISIDMLYAIHKGEGDTLRSVLEFVIEISESDSSNKIFMYNVVVGISKGGNYIMSLPFHLELDSFGLKEYTVSIFPISPKIRPDNDTDIGSNNVERSFSVSSVVESVSRKGKFSYPYSAKVRSTISSDHFNTDPSRSFDLKLKKVNVPNNYDAEVKEYSGNWSGVFDSFLRWSDNPAWIFYDICTNSRYGLGNGFINEKDLNKWELYKIAQECDSLVKTFASQKYEQDSFFTSQLETNDDIIYLEKGFSSLGKMKEKYSPVSGGDSDVNYENSLIFLFDVSDDSGQTFKKNLKKIVWDIKEGDISGVNGSSGDIGQFNEVTDGSGTVFQFKLVNDFGPKKKLQASPSDLISSISDKVIEITEQEDSLSDRLSKSCKNSENVVKREILYYYLNNKDSRKTFFVHEYLSESIFPSGYRVEESDSNFLKVIRGKCLPKSKGYEDALEQRFSANVYIDSEVECLKLLNDLASTFRGMAYYKNNFITSTIDVDTNPVYIFNNTNVKDGLFTYSSGSLDGNYSVAKVLYKDKNNIFEDAVEIVEDSELIKEYGIVVREVLGFGITSKGQAKRVGEWILATNRFENQTVTFTTDIQGLTLKPSDVIQIKDDKPSAVALQGRVISVDYDEKSIIVDRKIGVNLTGSPIKFLINSNVYNTSETSSEDLLGQDPNFEYFEIESIRNNVNKIYLHQGVNIEMVSAIASGSAFCIESVDSDSYNQSLYKVVNISEDDVNSYSFFCIKHNPLKYQAIDNKEFEQGESPNNSPVSFSSYKSSAELNISGFSSFYEVKKTKAFDFPLDKFDAFFTEGDSPVELEQDQLNFGELLIDFSSLKDQINSLSPSDGYYESVENVLDDGGGFICRILYKNQSIKFKVASNDIGTKIISLGSMDNLLIDNRPSSFLNIKFFVYNKENQIVEV